MTRSIPILLLLAGCAQATGPTDTGDTSDTSATDTGTTDTSTTDTAATPADHVVINELLSKNDSTNTDPAGEYDDWLELYNPTGAAIDLSNWALTDGDPADTGAPPWTFPASTSIASHGYLLVWCDDDSGEPGGLHADFKLSASGETITLIDDATIVEAIDMPALDADTTWARIPDGTDQWQVSNDPTPEAANTAR